MRFLFAHLLIALSGSVALAETDLPKVLQYQSAPATVLTGKKLGMVTLRFEVAKGFHVQANPADPPLIPTNVTPAKNKDLEIFSPKYPVGKKAMVKGLGREISTYEGNFSVVVPLRARKTTKAGAYKMEGEIRYQACDDKLCYPPQKAPFTALVTLK
jgi:hypothetical protein